ncbi:MAG: DUF6918 family protein [Panacagrimonas sp.]
MQTLADRLKADAPSESLITDCVGLIEKQVNSHGAIRRMALKAALAVLDSVKPNALRLIVADLLPRFAAALDPLYQRFDPSGGQEFSQFLDAHSEEAVAALLGVTDARVAAIDHGGVTAVYRKLRPTAQNEVRAAVPGLGKIISSHMG